MNTVAGWYGKIAGLGDFASRRLPADFVARWDAWLQRVMAASRSRLGAGWLDAYLSCPVWHFVAGPSAAGGALHAGALMPSVDKAGRYFPLCIAAPLPAPPVGAAEWRSLLDWLGRIEAAALETLDTRRSAQQFDDALLALPLPGWRRNPRALLMLDSLAGTGDVGMPAPAGGEALAELMLDAGALALARSMAGGSLWWTGANHQLFACSDLPDDESFAAMLRATGPSAVPGSAQAAAR